MLALSSSFLFLASCQSGGNRGDRLISEMSDVLPKEDVEKQVRELEASLAKKSAQFDRESAWRSLEAKLRGQKAKAEQMQKSAKKAMEAELASYEDAQKRWEQWSKSKHATGSLMDQLEAMVLLGDKQLEQATGGKFAAVEGQGHRLTLMTPEGVLIMAASYRGLDNKPNKTLTGIKLMLDTKLEEERAKMDAFEAFGLSKNDFKSVSSRWAPKGTTFNWKGAKKRHGNSSDLYVDRKAYYSTKRWQALVFWSGP